jgi:hypothetical protein
MLSPVPGHSNPHELSDRHLTRVKINNSIILFKKAVHF